MKKRVLSLVIVGLMVCTLFALPSLADDQQLTDKTQTGNTEVDATITDGSGEVAYIVTIPEKIDFGTLQCPETNVDSMTTQEFTVKCVKMQGVSLIEVSVRDENGVIGETNQNFSLSCTSTSFKPVYDLYAGSVHIDVDGALPADGFGFTTFSSEEQEVPGKVELNQKQLFQYKDNLASIAGSYTGKMVFTIAAQ